MMLRRILLPALILSAGALTAAFLAQGQAMQPPRIPEPSPPTIRVLRVQPETLHLSVASQGTVEPRTESQIVAQVPGQVMEIGPGLEPGAFFAAGDVLLRLDPRDLELAERRARAALDRARAEEEFAAASRQRRQRLGERGVASSSAIDEAMRAARTATARRVEAEIDLAQAHQDLERATIRAPFDGRTLERQIDVGRYVSTGTPIAALYAVDYAEIRLPVPDAELAFLDLPIGETVAPESAPGVELTATFAGEVHRWSGRIVRTEARIDPRTRMVHVIARVPRPYAPSPEFPGRPPLAAGLYVEAEIEGQLLENAVRIPREALDEEPFVYVLDEQDQLQRRRVQVHRYERKSALITAGLEASERVSLLEPRLASEGLEVRPVDLGTLADSGASARPAS